MPEDIFSATLYEDENDGLEIYEDDGCFDQMQGIVYPRIPSANSERYG